MTDGASRASPAATTRTAWTRSSRRTSLSRKPLAPARSASNTYSSRSNVVRMTTLTGSCDVGPANAAGGLDAVAAGHADVHEHDVGPFAPGDRHRLLAVGGLAHHREVGLGVDDHREAAAHQLLVVGDDHPHRASAHRRGTPS